MVVLWSFGPLVFWSLVFWSGRHRTANSTAPTSKFPSVYGPQDDRTGKTAPGSPPAGGPVGRSSLLRLSGTLESTLSCTLSQAPIPLWLSFLGTLGTLARLNYPRRVKE